MAFDLNVDEVKKFLAGSVLFQSADDSGLELIANQLERVRLRKGDPVVLENEISDHVYFVYSGSVEVVKHIGELNKLSRLAVLRKGDQFSEFSVLNRSRKGASVFALEDCEILRMNDKTFLNVLSQLPDVAKSLVTHIAKMTEHSQTSQIRFPYLKETQVALHPKVPQLVPPGIWQKHQALPVGLEGKNLTLAIQNPKNTVLFEQLKNTHPDLNIKITLINDEDFKELGKQLLEAYKAGPIETPSKNISEQKAFDLSQNTWLKEFSLFSNMPDEWLAQVIGHIQFIDLPTGEDLYCSGQPSSNLYFCLSGEIEMVYPLETGTAELDVGAVVPGEYFSEVSLLTGKPHILTARARTDSKLAYIAKEIFDELLNTPVFSIPLAQDLATQFQLNTGKESYHFFNSDSEVQISKLAHLIPKSILAQYQVLPLRLDDEELTVGITNPESATIYSVVSRYLHNYRVRLEIIHQDDFKKWFAQIDNEVDGATTTLGRPKSANVEKISPVEALNKIMSLGFDQRASDIHIEPQKDCFVVRLRVDGVLKEHAEKFSPQVGTEMVNRIKILSKLDVTNRMTPQDGQLNLDHNGLHMVARVSTLPTKRGENAVLRLIREKNSVPPLASLAADRRVVNILRQVVASQQGVFLVTGPTGSGKSTTLYSLLEELNRVEVSIISLEDPVELEVPGTTQVEMNEKTGLTFAKSLRSALRQDPNVIMIGEIRDEESAKIAFHAAATGHLVISTLHTNDSLSVVPRLLELGITRQALGSTLLGASAQRLARKICPSCVQTRPLDSSEAEAITADISNIVLPNTLSFGKGCSKCDQSGYLGRLPIMEIWTKTRAIESALLEGKSLDSFYSEIGKSDFETLRQFALRMACAGLTTLEEVERRFGGLRVPTEAKSAA